MNTKTGNLSLNEINKVIKWKLFVVFKTEKIEHDSFLQASIAIHVFRINFKTGILSLNEINLVIKMKFYAVLSLKKIITTNFKKINSEGRLCFSPFLSLALLS